MLQSYYKISVRMLMRHKLYALINILGLAVSMGVCLLIGQYVYSELSYDRFYTDAECTYRLTQTTVRRKPGCESLYHSQTRTSGERAYSGSRKHGTRIS